MASHRRPTARGRRFRGLLVRSAGAAHRQRRRLALSTPLPAHLACKRGADPWADPRLLKALPLTWLPTSCSAIYPLQSLLGQDDRERFVQAPLALPWCVEPPAAAANKTDEDWVTLPSEVKAGRATRPPGMVWMLRARPSCRRLLPQFFGITSSHDVIQTQIKAAKKAMRSRASATMTSTMSTRLRRMTSLIPPPRGWSGAPARLPSTGLPAPQLAGTGERAIRLRPLERCGGRRTAWARCAMSKSGTTPTTPLRPKRHTADPSLTYAGLVGARCRAPHLHPAPGAGGPSGCDRQPRSFRGRGPLARSVTLAVRTGPGHE